ncbi:hypothetical protein LMG3415_05191 [Achromobacter mucicolens]|uniref:Uncharacterized protein n=1 Tax=Achromobacter mucicolens TaxID=1389922 RepID=A0ABM8LKF3_9BURK|nr:hypothetical protein LMG3415_05191 [Achromobacter mucicolens]
MSSPWRLGRRGPSRSASVAWRRSVRAPRHAQARPGRPPGHRPPELGQGGRVQFVGAVGQALGQAQRHARRGQETARQRQGLVLQRLGRVQGVHEAEPLRFLGVDAPPRHQQFLGLGQADRARQQMQRAHVGQRPDAQEHHAERGARGGQDEVGAQREGEAAAPGRPVDRGDHGNLQVAQLLQPHVHVLQPLAHAGRLRAVGQAFAHGLDVAASAEAAVAAGQHQCARLVFTQRGQHVGVVGAQRHRQWAARFGAQVAEHRDAVGADV